jgi:hypothetical protein
MKISWILTGCLLMSASAYGQETIREYLFIAPARATGPTAASNSTFGILPPATAAVSASTSGSNTAYAGGLGVVLRLSHEGGLAQHFGAGIDLSAILPGKGQVGSATAGSLALNGYYHPLTYTTFDPFVTSGYSALFRDFAANGFNAGGGVNCWFSENWGLVVEIRQLIFNSSPALPARHYTEFRVGLAHRSQ